jgi:isopentenyl diphosphate isomerase/L-lactate dehydrogenase-like FMN-dependent dehydrogenase/rubredoxin
MSAYSCRICNIYTYDDDKGDLRIGIEPGTELADLPEGSRCPVCGAPSNSMKQIDEEETIRAVERYYEYLTELSATNREEMNLTEIRDNSRLRLKGICSANKICDGDPKRLCMGQKYGEPIGFGGGGKGMSFTANVEALDNIRLKTRLISEHQDPDMSTTIYATDISMPIMASSLSGVKASMGGSIQEEDFAYTVLKGCKDSNTLGWIGNTADIDKELCGVEAVRKVGQGIPIFKPQSNDKLMLYIKMAEEAGASAVGVDLDGAGSTNWERMNKPLFRKSLSELTELVGSTELPFIAKGIMSVEDALSAVDAGVAGIDVSNHGGRALDSTRGVAEILPEIAEAVPENITVTASGGVRTGSDVLKMLALGAHGVLIGRDIIRSVLGGGVFGVKKHFEYLVSDLRRGMILTSCNKIEDIDISIIDNLES